MSFGAAKSISRRLSIVEDYDVLILDLSEVPHIGVTASLAIENMVKEACEKRRSIFLVGASGKVRERLRRLELLDRLLATNQLPNRLEALETGLVIVRERH